MDLLEHEIRVTFRYPVYFSRDVFAPSNPLVLKAAPSAVAPKAARILFVVDSGVDAAHPALRESIGRYCAAHGGALELAAPVLVIPGGEQAKNDPAPTQLILQAIHDASLDRHSYVAAIGGGAVLDVVGLRGGDGAPGDPPDPVSDHGAGAGRFGGRRQERHQRLRPEELSRHLHAALRRRQRFELPDDAVGSRLVRRTVGGGEGGAHQGPHVLRRHRGAGAGARRARHDGDGTRGAAIGRAPSPAHCHGRGSIRDGQLAAARLRPLGGPQARAADRAISCATAKRSQSASRSTPPTLISPAFSPKGTGGESWRCCRGSGSRSTHPS